jgi:NAD(P)-dependent dehydrogenase (short-subunit alcohol dehydrogenase family)
LGSLDGRVAIVTGAGRGVGREHALLLAAEGAAVVVNDLGSRSDGGDASTDPAESVAEEITTAGGNAIANCDDVSSWDGAHRLVDDAVATFGRLDVLVNNAGILRDRALVNMTEEDWELSIRVNLKGHFAPISWAAKYWRGCRKNGEDVVASIVNTSSESGVFANAGQANYACAKAGVAALTEVCHKELGRYGVRTNAILPRARTRLTEGLLGERAQPKQGRFDRWHPANVSPFVAYLATESCSISGHVFLVAGGQVRLARPWSLDEGWKIEAEGRWTVASLHSAVDVLGVPAYDGRDTGSIS